MITQRDIGWVAGFLEGEGSFRLNCYRRRSGGTSATPNVSACQVQHAPLDRLKALFGGSIYWRPNKGSGIFTWELCGPSAMGLMLTLYAMLSPRRREQVRRAVIQWKARPGKGIRNRNKTHCPHGHSYDTANTLLKKGGRRRICRSCYDAFWAKNGKKYYERQRLRRAAVKMLSA